MSANEKSPEKSDEEVKEYKLYINGQWVESKSGEIADDLNPATGQVYARVHQAGAEDFEDAISAATEAAKTWGKTLASERETLLLKAAGLAAQRLPDIAATIVADTGGTQLKAGFEAGFVVNMLRSAAGECRRIFGETIPADSPGMFSMTIRRPLGVIAGISPFNFPFLLSTKKVCMALAAGNTFVLKPAPQTPVIGAVIADLFDAAGLPPGVLNVVAGDAPVFGDMVTSDPRISMVTFTGSTKVGQMLAVKCAQNNKRITLEMGGKSPFIVLKDADVDYAVDTASFNIFLHQGQICMAGTRVIVEAPIYDEFCDKLAAKAKGLKVGDPADSETVIGPLITETKCDEVNGVLEDAKSKGAEILTGGTWEGPFFTPTVVKNVTQEMTIFQHECFAPVVVVVKADDHEHALELANDNEYGLSSAVMTNNLDMAMFFAHNIEAGMTHINHGTVYDEPHVPFGGVKNSGMGREGGQWSMEEMTEVKWVTISSSEGHPYPF